MMHQDGLTKMMEECGELIQIAAKKSAYYNTDQHPDGKGSLLQRLQDEAADVMAAILFVVETHDLDEKAIWLRVDGKLNQYHEWQHERPVAEPEKPYCHFTGAIEALKEEDDRT
ncbi:MAG: hypothetical protein KME45_02890 [Stenomitos rutilans HA7619-LM2]|jgi:NTP pyrophosphatase (non-canonical NTP hydrolase)|nr:hypothetical protein [Stenomitos rutilans HA7619-LM2]MBW4469330.1 hypothetical protein [Stenomitos rutilans HA7619-LM2]